MTTTIEQTIDVNVPVRTAYNQWTQFEEFPEFMQGVEYVQQIDDTHLRWKAEIGGTRHEWDAEITEQRPDERVAWKTMTGRATGVVTFHRLGEDETRVMVQMDWQPEGIKESAGSALRVRRPAREGRPGALQAGRRSRGTESGAWRGEVDQTATR